MPSLPTRIIIWFEKVLRMDERMSRYAGAADDRDKFTEYIQRMRRLDQKNTPQIFTKIGKNFRAAGSWVSHVPFKQT